MLLLACVIFGLVCAVLAILFSYKEEKAKKLLINQNKDLSRHAYQLEVLASLQEKIGLSLSIFEIAETITMTIERVLDVTTVSYAVIDKDKIHLHSFPRQPVADFYLHEVNKRVLDSIYNIDPHAKEIKVDESRSSSIQLSSNTFSQDILPVSFITIPMILNEDFVGVIAVSSHIENSYSEEDIKMLNRIVNQAISSLEHMQTMLDIEQVKTDSLIMNLSAGAILFLFKNEGIQLASINNAALEYLELPVSPTTDQVIDTLNSHVSIIDIVKEALSQKDQVIKDDIPIKDKHFKLFIRPVTYAVTQKVIGISLTLQDVTSEKELATLRDQSVNMMVHELRAPLTSIKGAASLLSKGDLKKDDREHMLKRIQISTERMLRDISNFLDAAKVEGGKFAISLRESSLNEVVLNELDLMSSIAEEKHVTIRHDLDSRLGQFYFDKDRIAQVVTNLLSNSIKFVSEGGEIAVSTRIAGSSVEVMVKDNGVGIPPEKIPTLFSRYQQVKNQYQRGGTGLGLYISKQIIEAHHGKIWIESDEGVGTEIRFALPLLHHVRPQGHIQDPQDAEEFLN